MQGKQSRNHRGPLAMYEERKYMTKFKTAEGRSFQISIANNEEQMLTLHMAARGNLLIRKSVRDFVRIKGYLGIFDGFLLKTKAFSPMVCEIFLGVKCLPYGCMQFGLFWLGDKSFFTAVELSIIFTSDVLVFKVSFIKY